MARKPSIEIGDTFTTNQGYTVKVISYRNKRDITIMFESGHTKRTEAVQLRGGQIRNPYHATVFGVGYVGDGPHKTYLDGNKTEIYSTWYGMLARCYDEKFLEKNPSYRECSACEDWCNFQAFADWYIEQPNAGKEGFQLDKDLIKIGNKVYSPDTCSFVPREINTLLTDHRAARGALYQGVHNHKPSNKYIAQLSRCSDNRSYLGSYETPQEAFAVYKREKEKFVKEQAEKYKELLHPKVYENLMSYEVKPA